MRFKPKPSALALKIEIHQELTLERQAFEARMKITNGMVFQVEEILVDVLFQDENGSYVWASSDPNDIGACFFNRPEGSRERFWSAPASEARQA